MHALRPARNDVLLAIGVALLACLEVWLNPNLHPRWAAAATEIPGALALAWRRRFPLLSLTLIAVAAASEVTLGVSVSQPLVPLVLLVVSLYSVAVHEPRARAAAGLGVMTSAGFVMSLDHHGRGVRLGNFLFGLVIMVSAWSVGRVVLVRTQTAGALARRADQLELEMIVAVADERARIARELHDVIAHSVSVMVVQAGAAQAVLLRDPAGALEPLAAVQQTGRAALVEMGRLVGLLREGGEELGFAPQPGLGRVDELVTQMRDAGLPVELRIEGVQRPVPLGVDLSAYRVVQEALTNALKHGGRAQTEVWLRYGDDSLEIEVLDDGSPTGNGHAGGHGLVGMRERVSIFGGDFSAGPRSGGGFAVHARLPLEAVSV